jgi:hypothetical protein
MKALAFRAVLVFAAVLSISKPAFANSFTLNQSGCCGLGPFGTVTLSVVDSDTVDVLVTLNPTPAIAFVDTGNGPPGDHPDFAWNLSGSLTGVSIAIIQSGGDGWTFYDVHSSPITMSNSYGTYQFALYCNGIPACGPGASNPNFGPLEFQVTRTGGITESSFVPNDAGSIFVADIINGVPNGNTGLVRTTGQDRGITAVPEPATLTLVGLGVFGLAKRARRKLR